MVLSNGEVQSREVQAGGLVGAAESTAAKLAVWPFLVGVLPWTVGQLMLAMERAGRVGLHGARGSESAGRKEATP